MITAAPPVQVSRLPCGRLRSTRNRMLGPTLMLTVILVFSAGAMADTDPVGKTFWARPGLWETSIDFHADVELRGRVPVYEKRAFMVEGLVMGGPWPCRDPIYRVRFDDGSHAFIDAGDFAERQYHELRPNEVAASPSFEPPLGRGIQVHTFERSSIFARDPDEIWQRVKDQGPRTFSPVPVRPPKRHRPGPAPDVVREPHPVNPVISPR